MLEWCRQDGEEFSWQCSANQMLKAVDLQIWEGHKHLCANCSPYPHSWQYPTLSLVTFEGKTVNLPFLLCLQGISKCFSAALFWVKTLCWPPLPQDFMGSSGSSRLNEEQYSNTGDFRLCSRTKRLHYPLDVGKENLTDPWYISAEPGGCWRQRDLTPLWHRRARGKFLLSTRGSRGRLTLMRLRRQHQKLVSSTLEGRAGRQREPWDAEYTNDTQWSIWLTN